MFSEIRNHNNDSKGLLFGISEEQIQKRIKHFRSQNLHQLSNSELVNAIYDVLLIEDLQTGGKRAFNYNLRGTYPPGTLFYRVRKVDPNKSKTPYDCMPDISHAWNPPPRYCRLGRLNNEEESMLYTSPINQSVALDEMAISPGELACIIVYNAIEKINVVNVTPSYEQLAQNHAISKSLNKGELKKFKLFHDFLRDEFTRKVENGTEHFYRISICILKEFFDLPPEVFDGWCYPSVAKNKTACNVCFKPDNARAKLRLQGVLIGHRGKANKENWFSVKCVAEGNSEDGSMIYHQIGSKSQMRLFPGIS